VIASVRKAFADAATQSTTAVILTQPDIRRFVRKLLEPQLPDAWVVSYAELLPEVALKPVARATPG
jgi:type III secretion protein V